MYRSAVKQLFNSKDMRGSTLAWCQKHQIPDPATVLDIRVDLLGWSHLLPFTVRGYFNAIADGLDDIDNRCSRTVASFRNGDKPGSPQMGTLRPLLSPTCVRRPKPSAFSPKSMSPDALTASGCKPLTFNTTAWLLVQSLWPPRG